MAFSKDSLVYTKCTGCHDVVGGKISRIEEIRSTPEEWEVIVERMSRLHGMPLDGKKEMVALKKELCSTQILSPEESEKVAYLNLYNNPQTVELDQRKGPEQERFFKTCVRCHSAAKIDSFRMTKTEWAKVRNFHLYMDPAIMFQMREMRFEKEADAVLEYLARKNAYGQAWKAPAASPAGSWLIFGYEPGKGGYQGKATIKQAGSNGDFSVEGTLAYADGTSEKFSGEAVLYGGHQLRTRTQHNGFKTLGAYTFSDGRIRGDVHFPAPDFRTSTSSWYRDGAPAQVVKVTPEFLLTRESTTITLEGVNLPAVKGSDIKFSDGDVEVLSARRINGETIEAQVVYQGTGLARKSGVSVKGISPVPITLATQIDSISVTPSLGRARVSGGATLPAEGMVFQAFAYASGVDVSDTSKDTLLGEVPAQFKLSEEVTRTDDDDLYWVGNIGRNGKYIPHGDYGPVSSRDLQSEAIGLVKVEAEYKRGDRIYFGKAKLAVTEPDFVHRIK
jgi:quinohemoprotein amine dehydrogenase